jgi:hypothetical protein
MSDTTSVVAALYVDVEHGPYPNIPGVECWGLERDAMTYRGPWPVVAHPPCGHWGRYHHRAHDDGRTGPVAVGQVRRFGGVLEQPANSKLWRHCNLPEPGCPPDHFGGWSLSINQCDFGHPALKPTWLYIVGCYRLPPMPRAAQTQKPLEHLSKVDRLLTPDRLAMWLVELARVCHGLAVRDE